MSSILKSKEEEKKESTNKNENEKLSSPSTSASLNSDILDEICDWYQMIYTNNNNDGEQTNNDSSISLDYAWIWPRLDNDLSRDVPTNESLSSLFASKASAASTEKTIKKLSELLRTYLSDGQSRLSSISTTYNYIREPSSDVQDNDDDEDSNISLLYNQNPNNFIYACKHPALALLILHKNIQKSIVTQEKEGIKTCSMISIYDINTGVTMKSIHHHYALTSYIRSHTFLSQPLIPTSLAHLLLLNNNSHNNDNNTDNHDPSSAISQQQATNNNDLALVDIDIKIRFLFLQLLHIVSFAHSQNITLVSPDNDADDTYHKSSSLFVQNDGWLRVVFPIIQKKQQQKRYLERQEDLINNIVKEGEKNKVKSLDSQKHNNNNQTTSTEETTRLNIVPKPKSLTTQWVNGQISNLDYLLLLNLHAGRTLTHNPFDSQHRTPIFPWVTDFTEEIYNVHDVYGGIGGGIGNAWRDLRKSKYRLAKGDFQLDQTFLNTLPKHHVPEPISDISSAVYRSRCLPMHVLKERVRPVFVPQHYPKDMKGLYKWTPDEATYDFYYYCSSKENTNGENRNIFKSCHTSRGLHDLIVPDWCTDTGNNESYDECDDDEDEDEIEVERKRRRTQNTAQDIQRFIDYHRKVLEGDAVSRWLHIWIDLNFGVALTGNRAIEEKNVPLRVLNLSSSYNTDDTDSNDDHDHDDETQSQEEKEEEATQESEYTNPSCYVFVQLFNTSHPKRKYGNRGNLLSTQQNNNKEEDNKVKTTTLYTDNDSTISDMIDEEEKEKKHNNNNNNKNKSSSLSLINDFKPVTEKTIFSSNHDIPISDKNNHHMDFIYIASLVKEMYSVAGMTKIPNVVQEAIEAMMMGYTGVKHLSYTATTTNNNDHSTGKSTSSEGRDSLFSFSLMVVYKLLSESQQIKYQNHITDITNNYNNTSTSTTDNSCFSSSRYPGLLSPEATSKIPSTRQVYKALELGSRIEHLSEISPRDIGLLLPTIEYAFESVIPYIQEELEYQNQKLSHADVNRKSHRQSIVKMLFRFIDSFGEVIGKEGTSKYILPKIMGLMEQASNGISCCSFSNNAAGLLFQVDGLHLLQTFLLSPLFPTLYSRCSTAPFVRLFFPFIIRLLIKEDETEQRSTSTSTSSINDMNERGHYTKEEEIKLKYCDQLVKAKKAASVSLTILAQEKSLLPLYSKFIIPSFIKYISDSNNNSSSYGGSGVKSNQQTLLFMNDNDDDDEEREPTSSAVFKCAVAQSLEALVSFLPNESIELLICKPLVKHKIPALLNFIRCDIIKDEAASSLSASGVSQYSSSQTQHTTTQKQNAINNKKSSPSLMSVEKATGSLAQIVSLVRSCIPYLSSRQLLRFFFRSKYILSHQILVNALGLVLFHKRRLQRANNNNTNEMNNSNSNSTNNNNNIDPSSMHIQMTLYLLSESGRLVCSLCRHIETKKLGDSVLKIIEVYCARLIREYNHELLACIQKLQQVQASEEEEEDNEDDEEEKERIQQVVEKEVCQTLDSLPGVYIAKEFYHTVSSVVGKEEIAVFCPSLDKFGLLYGFMK